MGQERSTPWQRNKPLAKNALPAAVVPRRDRAKGNREERGGHHATIWTDLSTKHAEEIKVMQAPFKCASMLGHRLRSIEIRLVINQSINQLFAMITCIIISSMFMSLNESRGGTVLAAGSSIKYSQIRSRSRSTLSERAEGRASVLLD